MEISTVYLSDTTLLLAGLVAVVIVVLLVSKTRRSESITPTEGALSGHDPQHHTPVRKFDVARIDDGIPGDASRFDDVSIDPARTREVAPARRKNVPTSAPSSSDVSVVENELR